MATLLGIGIITISTTSVVLIIWLMGMGWIKLLLFILGFTTVGKRQDRDRMIKQTNIGNWWGAIMTLAGRLNIYVSMMNLILIAFFAYPSVTGFIVNYTGIVIPFWLFILVIILSPFIIMILEYKFSLPSYIAFNNQQAYAHDNPIRKDIEDMQEDITEIKGLLDKLANKPIDKQG